ncbi:RING-H2 finger protein [Musa troglodytarum]|uniref:RING-H2 finger protein n=1 Tax=Musa troglodytarum TaxID=320322 RepID=A0A9E7JPE8_9LILI|nr:RING-H2 finger protein [Musa troglodytarum]
MCLTEFKDGYKGWLLLRCSHRFHADCIDMWFQSHSACPIYRSAVEPKAPGSGSTKHLASCQEFGYQAKKSRHYAKEIAIAGSSRVHRSSLRVRREFTEKFVGRSLELAKKFIGSSSRVHREFTEKFVGRSLELAKKFIGSSPRIPLLVLGGTNAQSALTLDGTTV